MNELPCENLLVGISGSIHALQIHSYLYRFRNVIAPHLKVIMTRAAAEMVAPKTVELYTDDRVFIDSWDSSPSTRSPHIQLTRWADLFVVIPATADILGKAANGIADDLLSSAILGAGGPVAFAPAMNPAMWDAPATRRNVARLREDGHYVVDPLSGLSVTTGQWDRGLSQSPEHVCRHLLHFRFAQLRELYWGEATSEPAKSPSLWKANLLASAHPD